MPLWAVHISDGQLEPVWLLGGFVLAGLLTLLAGLRLREEDLPRVALLGAAFFVASQIHVRLGPTSAHLLLNGLAGVLLGWQATLAIAAGLFLQKAFFDHGGYLTLGVNVCVMALPALGAGLLFRLLHRPGRRRPRLSGVLVGVSALAWTLSLVFSVALLATNRPGSQHDLDPEAALRLAFHPLTLAAALLVALLAARAERRLGAAPEFALGLLLGELAVLLTLALNALVLLAGGIAGAGWQTLLVVLFLVHLPIAVIEGTVLGFAVGFLARVKPEMLGLSMPAPRPADVPVCS